MRFLWKHTPVKSDRKLSFCRTEGRDVVCRACVGSLRDADVFVLTFSSTPSHYFYRDLSFWTFNLPLLLKCSKSFASFTGYEAKLGEELSFTNVRRSYFMPWTGEWFGESMSGTRRGAPLRTSSRHPPAPITQRSAPPLGLSARHQHDTITLFHVHR